MENEDLNKLAEERAAARQAKEELEKIRAQIQAEKDEVARMKQEAEQAKKDAASKAAALETFRYDPVGSIGKMQLDDAQRREIARKLQIQDLGDDALPEERASLYVDSLKAEFQQWKEAQRAEMEALKQELAEERKANAQNAQRAKWVASFEQATKAEDFKEKYGELAIYSTGVGTSEQFHQELMQVAAGLYQSKGAEPSLDEVMEAANAQAARFPWVKELSEYRKTAAEQQDAAKNKETEQDDSLAAQDPGASPTLKGGDSDLSTAPMDPNSRLPDEEERDFDELLKEKLAAFHQAQQDQDIESGLGVGDVGDADDDAFLTQY